MKTINWRNLLVFIGIGLFFFQGPVGIIIFATLILAIIAHEMGHAIMAERFGLQVEQVSLGFGPEITQWTDRYGTQIVVRSIPLGGYTRLPEDIFLRVTTWQHVLITLGGIIANFIAAILGTILFAAIWIIFSFSNSYEMSSMIEMFEGVQRTGDLVVTNSLDGFFSLIFMCVIMNLLFGAVQLLPVTFFDGARIVEILMNAIMSHRRRTYWALEDNTHLTHVWSGVSILVVIILWLI